MTAVFLDLDGTLMDSRPGIEAALRHAFRTTGPADVAETDLRWMIGPSFHESFGKLGIVDVPGTLAAYREVYTSGQMFDAIPYDGVFDALDSLSRDGHRLFLMTAKPHEYARRITAHFGLASYFEAEYGPESDGTRGHKADLLAHALGETGVQADCAVMVGDRVHDVEAGHANAMPVIAAAWGYGGPEEWDGVRAVADTPHGLPTLVADTLRGAAT